MYHHGTNSLNIYVRKLLDWVEFGKLTLCVGSHFNGWGPGLRPPHYGCRFDLCLKLQLPSSLPSSSLSFSSPLPVSFQSKRKECTVLVCTRMYIFEGQVGICKKVLFVLFSLELSPPHLPLALKLTYRYLVFLGWRYGYVIRISCCP